MTIYFIKPLSGATAAMFHRFIQCLEKCETQEKLDYMKEQIVQQNKTIAEHKMCCDTRNEATNNILRSHETEVSEVKLSIQSLNQKTEVTNNILRSHETEVGDVKLSIQSLNQKTEIISDIKSEREIESLYSKLIDHEIHRRDDGDY